MLAIPLLLAAIVAAPQEPLRIAVIGKEDSPHKAFVRGANRAVEAINNKGEVKVELLWRSIADKKQAAATCKQLPADGVHAVVAPLEVHTAELTKKALGATLPLLYFDSAPEDVAKVLDRLLEQRLCMTRVGLITDRSRPAKAFAKLLETNGLTRPSQLLWKMDVSTSQKKLDKKLESDRPEVLVFDTDPVEARRFLEERLKDNAIPIVLTPRAFGAGMLKQTRTVFAIHGLSPAQVATESAFRRDYETSHGIPGMGAAEGYEAILAVVQAVANAGSREPSTIRSALESLAIEGIRGRFGFDKKLGAFDRPLGVWLLEDERMVPYAPLVVPLGKTGTQTGTQADTQADTKTDDKPTEARKPDATVGVPFGTWRTRQFQFEAGAQWVLLLWSDEAEFATSADDLLQMGLSTGGKVPLVDHLVREEIFARCMAITSTKWGRNEDGSAIQGKSLRISFGSHIDAKARKKKKQRLWVARFGGDHEGAGGQAFGTYCRVYTKFIRRTIFDKNPLNPVLSASDREILDGSYIYGTNVAKDNRSNRVRALINAYAGSMALTLAHEVGHLATLGHVTDDPVEIMNVEEGAGIDYPEARFGEGSWATLTKRLGIVGDGTKRKK
tara:strand:+ start:65978 stop:67819 length:1842 start_codon:yes stop_codon:yes gene_type:complete